MKKLLIFFLLFASCAFAGEDAGLAGAAYSLVNPNGNKIRIYSDGSVSTSPGAGNSSVTSLTNLATATFDLQWDRTLSTQTVTGNRSSVLGGLKNTISGANSTILGGNLNVVSSANSVVLGGQVNNVSGAAGSALGSSNSTVSGAAGCVIGGNWATVSGTYATVIQGYRGIANKPSQIAHAVAGDPGAGFTFQTSELISFRLTTDATVTQLTPLGSADAANNRWFIASGTSITARIQVAGISTDTSRLSVGYVMTAKIKRLNNTVTVATSSTEIIEDAGLEGCSTDVTVDSTNGAWSISVIGSTTTNIRWVASVRMTEVNQP